MAGIRKAIFDVGVSIGELAAAGERLCSCYDAMREAFRKYAKHLDGCDSAKGYNCNCGLEEAIKQNE